MATSGQENSPVFSSNPLQPPEPAASTERVPTLSDYRVLQAQAQAAIQEAQVLKAHIAEQSRSQSPSGPISVRDSILKRFKPPVEIDFRWRNNKDRYTFARALEEKLLDLYEASETPDPALQEIIQDVAEELKNILLADDPTNPFGWNLVRSYRQHSLASNDADDRRIKKAKKDLAAAAATKKPLWTQQTTNVSNVYRRPQPYAVPMRNSFGGSTSGIPSLMQQQLPYPIAQSTNTSTCHKCHQPGHFARQCPNARSQSLGGRY